MVDSMTSTKNSEIILFDSIIVLPVNKGRELKIINFAADL